MALQENPTGVVFFDNQGRLHERVRNLPRDEARDFAISQINDPTAKKVNIVINKKPFSLDLTTDLTKESGEVSIALMEQATEIDVINLLQARKPFDEGYCGDV